MPISKHCPFCNTAVSLKVKTCHGCGAHKSSDLHNYPGAWMMFAIAAMLWFAAGPLIGWGSLQRDGWMLQTFCTVVTLWGGWGLWRFYQWIQLLQVWVKPLAKRAEGSEPNWSVSR
jgi:hypothetical protein